MVVSFTSLVRIIILNCVGHCFGTIRSRYEQRNVKRIEYLEIKINVILISQIRKEIDIHYNLNLMSI